MRKVTEGKIPMDLLPGWRALAPVARVMHWANTAGGYVRDTWRTVPPEAYRAALARHFFAWLDDPHARDEKSGHTHLAHLTCCALFLLWHGDGDLEPELSEREKLKIPAP